jgi:hypothetical protein
MLENNPVEQQIAARLLDFFHWRAPWHRTLWSPGIGLVLQEVLEASEAVAQHVLTQASLKNLTSTAIELAGPDPGCGDATRKKLLQNALQSDLKYRSMEYHTIEAIAKDLDRSYLKRWSDSVATNLRATSVERTARAIASHLLDLGFSPDFLHRWWKYRIFHEPGNRTLSDLIADAFTLSQQPCHTYEVLIAFDAIPSVAQMPSGWMEAQEVSTWLTQHGFRVAGVRQNGGFVMEIEARDPYAAVETARERIENFAARVAVGTYGEIKAVPKAWIASEREPFPLNRPRRGVEIHTLQRENQLYVEGKLSEVDAAIGLLRPVNAGTTSAAIAGAWAAIETLLCGPGDEERVQAADRLAAIVACSFPRADLTQVSYAVEKAGGPLVEQLRSCGSNRERARLMATLIDSGAPLPLRDLSDVAAVERIKSISMNPRSGLRDVVRYTRAAFRRLYRCRNMVLHWGRIEGEIRKACLRTTAPLIGAGIDRIAHAWFIGKITRGHLLPEPP